ncbi:hypothetical protein LTR95_012320 [Oleoguttula sp. CCFEE 5521]
MSLYHEAAVILNTVGKDKTSLKNEVFGKKEWKSDKKTLFALTSEAAKWSEVLSEVVERSGVLAREKALSPTLALVLTHDLLLSKKGIALPATHGLRSRIAAHKARFSAELTKARLRRGFATLDLLRAHIDETGASAADVDDGDANTESKPFHPRWIRINTLRTTLEEQLKSTFAGFEKVRSVSELRNPKAKLVYVDEHVPNLIAVPVNAGAGNYPAYREGKLIFQDKASCFPAYLLDPKIGDVIDTCAAPGNKTTHVAAIMYARSDSGFGTVYACEKDPIRSKTLEKMTKLADPHGIIQVKAEQNCLKLHPDAKEYANVKSLLLDPSCSGSGIVSRDEGGVVVHLPSATASDSNVKKGKKRKRGPAVPATPPTSIAAIPPASIDIADEEQPEANGTSEVELHTRLIALADFQLRLLKHAMKFTSAERISYSTCSIHAEENEMVVLRALASPDVQAAGWRMLRRDEQVEGMKCWHRRGDTKAVEKGLAVLAAEEAGSDDVERIADVDAETITEACIRCDKNGDEGTMGFFVAGFVRGPNSPSRTSASNGTTGSHNTTNEPAMDEDEWNGFGSD